MGPGMLVYEDATNTMTGSLRSMTNGGLSVSAMSDVSARVWVDRWLTKDKDAGGGCWRTPTASPHPLYTANHRRQTQPAAPSSLVKVSRMCVSSTAPPDMVVDKFSLTLVRPKDSVGSPVRGLRPVS